MASQRTADLGVAMMEVPAPDFEPLRSRFWADDEPVVKDRKTIEGFSVPTFGEAEWDLRCIIPSSNLRHSECILRFSHIADPVQRITLKELIAQKLCRPLPSPRATRRPRISGGATAKAVFRGFREICEFMGEERGKTRLVDVDQKDVDAFLSAMQSEDRQLDPQSILRTIYVFDHLRSADEVLTYDHLTFLPWPGKKLRKVVGFVQPEHNKTPWIPDAVMKQTLFWALLYVDCFAPDILAACERVREHDRTAGDAVPVIAKPGANMRETLGSYVAVLRAEGRRIPSYYKGSGPLKPRWVRVAAEAGFRHDCIGAIKSELWAAVEKIGLDPDPLGVPICVPPGAETTWRRPFDIGEARSEAAMLVAACYVICAYLTGMRDGEVQALTRGCIETERDAYGGIVRQRIKGKAFKDKTEILFEQRKWVVIEEVVTAVRCMEALTSFTGDTQGGKLFIQLDWILDHDNSSLKRTVNDRLRAFRDHVNDKLVPRLGPDRFQPIPMDNGRPWSFTTRQFRRTLAYHIANQPFGTVAGMIQYGHLSEVIFEGYAGRPEAGLRDEVHAERIMARTKDVLELYEDSRRGVLPAGPMAAELLDEFERLKVDLSPLPGFVVTERERGALLRHMSKRLHPGLLADCFFHAPDAHCLGLNRADASAPIAGICDPHCPNACWTKRHLPVWEEHSRDVVKLARSNRISPLTRKVLKATVERNAEVVAEIRRAAGLPPKEMMDA